MPRSLAFPRSRVGLATRAVLALLPLLAACRSAPSPEDWMAVGFETPEQTMRSFQTGLRGNKPDLEYRSFSQGFRADHRLSQMVYRELRDEIFGSYPFLRQFAELEVLHEQIDGPTRRTLFVQVSALFAKRWIEVRFVRDDFYSVRNTEAVFVDDYADFHALVYTNEPGDALVLVLPTELPLDPQDVTRIEVGQEWKIDGFREIDAPPEP